MGKVIFAYHSIDSKQNRAIDGSFPITMDRFIHQIETLQAKGWKAGKTSEIHQPNEKNTFYITGDDGTSDWRKNVLPWCEDNKIPTHTALISGPWLENPIYPLTHHLQLLLVMRDASQLKKLSTKLKSKLDSYQIDYINKMYSHETLSYRRIIKGAINLIFEPEEGVELIGKPTAAEKKALENRFSKPKDYLPFSYAEFGVHTVSHFGVGKDIESYVDQEVLPNKDHILNAGLSCTNIFTLPMKPRHGVKNMDLQPILSKFGFSGMFTDEGVWDQRDFIINRIDAKNVEAFTREYVLCKR